MLSQNKKQECYMNLFFTVSEKELEASYHVTKLIERQKNLIRSYYRPKCIKTSMPGNRSINAWTEES